MIRKCDCEPIRWHPHTVIELPECRCAPEVFIERAERRRRRAHALLIAFILTLWGAALVTYVLGSR